MGILSFDICALIILVILAASILSRKLYVGRSNRLFVLMLFLIIDLALEDIILNYLLL